MINGTNVESLVCLCLVFKIPQKSQNLSFRQGCWNLSQSQWNCIVCVCVCDDSVGLRVGHRTEFYPPPMHPIVVQFSFSYIKMTVCCDKLRKCGAQLLPCLVWTSGLNIWPGLIFSWCVLDWNQLVVCRSGAELWILFNCCQWKDFRTWVMCTDLCSGEQNLHTAFCMSFSAVQDLKRLWRCSEDVLVIGLLW